jgi:hypothetical protein
MLLTAVSVQAYTALCLRIFTAGIDAARTNVSLTTVAPGLEALPAKVSLDTTLTAMVNDVVASHTTKAAGVVAALFVVRAVTNLAHPALATIVARLLAIATAADLWRRWRDLCDPVVDVKYAVGINQPTVEIRVPAGTKQCL